MDEAATRKLLIDAQLATAGWRVDDASRVATERPIDLVRIGVADRVSELRGPYGEVRLAGCALLRDRQLGQEHALQDEPPLLARPAARALTPMLWCTLLAAAALLAAGCRTVTIEPTGPEWTVAGEGDEATALWSADDVEIVVPLELGRGATSVVGAIRNRGATAVQVAFFAPGTHELEVLGTVTGARWSENILAGEPIDVPGGTAEAPGTVRFALRPDEPWSASETPAIGTRVTCEIDVTSPGGTVTCPVGFRVAATSGWLSEGDTAIVVTILACAGLVAWAGSGFTVW